MTDNVVKNRIRAAKLKILGKYLVIILKSAAVKVKKIAILGVLDGYLTSKVPAS